MRANGRYHGSYEVVRRPSTLAPLRRAFVLPGQGAAFPGMFADHLPSIAPLRERLAIADQLARSYDLLPISNYLTKPNTLPDGLTHIYRNCALYVCQVALAEFIISRGQAPEMITAHSFGECAGLTIAGALSFEEMFEIVVLRNVLAPPRNDLGFMVAVTGDRAALAPALAIPGVYYANRNSHRQSVLAVASSARAPVLQWLRSERIPHVILLQLPQPYHSPLMQDFADKLKERISLLKLAPKPVSIPIYSGVLHRWIDSAQTGTIDYVDLIARQALEPVDFVDQLEALRERGARSLYEIGPGQMLEPSIKSIFGDKDVAYRHTDKLLRAFVPKVIEKSANLEKLSRTKWFQKIRTAIQTVAGYQSEDIDIAHSFQLDLGLDSIKKAEILFRIIDDEKLAAGSDFSIAQLSTISQAVEYLENYTAAKDPLRESHRPQTTLLEPFWRSVPRVGHFALDAAAKDYQCLRIVDSDDTVFSCERYRPFLAQALSGGKKPLVIWECTQQKQSPLELLAHHRQEYEVFVGKERPQAFDLVLLDRTPEGAFAPLAALLKSLRKEATFCRFLYVRSDRNVSDEELAHDVSFSTVRNVRYHNADRQVADFRPLTLERRIVRDRPLTVLAAGGAQGIGYEVLRSFPVIPGDRLILLGRRPSTDPGLVSNLAQLRSHWPSLMYLTVDVTDRTQLETSVRAAASDGKIDVLLNACGKEVSQRFETKLPDEIEDEFHSKWLAFQNLEGLKRSYSIPKVIHYSSVVTEFGNRGQAVYSYSNALIAQASQQSGSHAIGWGPWDGVGMTASPGIQQRLREWGASFVAPADGARLAHQLIFTSKSVGATPFAFDYKDLFLFSLQLQSLGEVTSFTGALSNAFEATFTKEFDVKAEPFLKDHCYEGRPLVSASYLAATFVALGRIQFGRIVTLKNFVIQNLIRLEEDGRFEAKLQAFFRAPHRLQMYSVISHCSGEFDPEHVVKDQAATPLVVKRTLDAQALARQWVLEFGPSYHVARQTEVSADHEVALVVDAQNLPRYLGDPLFDSTLALSELAFESFTVMVSVAVDGTTVPIGFDALEFSQEHPLTRHLRVRPTVHKREGRFWWGDVEVQNEYGQVAMRFVNVKVKVYLPGSSGVKAWEL